MKLVPLLALQREIYNVAMPNRFQAYLDTMLLENRQDIRYPWSHVNPMAKSHLSDVLDQLLEMQVEDDLQESSRLLQESSQDWSVGLVLVDDVLGGWTDRVDVEFQNSFLQVQPLLKRGWVEVLLWASDYCHESLDRNGGDGIQLMHGLMENDESSLKTSLLEATERSIYRSIYQHQQRNEDESTENDCIIKTLRDMMDQESWVQEQLYRDTMKDHTGSVDSGLTKDVESSLNILQEYKYATIDESFPTVIAAYYGDKAAEKCGYPSLGMKAWSGQRICKSGRWNTIK